MANTTRKNYETVHGTNPQYIIEKITRCKIYECLYWKQHCFALTAELLVDKAINLKYIGGTYGGLRKPTPFICLILKMLQIQPSKDIIIEFIKQNEYKYVRILGAFYLRLIGKSMDIYRYLEPLYSDYRKIRRRKLDGKYEIIHVDELIDKFLIEEYYLEISLPHLTKRNVLEENNQLKPRISALIHIDKDLNALNNNNNNNGNDNDNHSDDNSDDNDDDDDDIKNQTKTMKKIKLKHSRSRSVSNSSDRSSTSTSRSRSKSKSRSRSRSRSGSRSRTKSKDRRRHRRHHRHYHRRR